MKKAEALTTAEKVAHAKKLRALYMKAVRDGTAQLHPAALRNLNAQIARLGG